MKIFRLAFFLFVVIGIGTLHAQTTPPLKIVSFIPSDCKPFENREERLGRVMNHVRDFYSRGMETNGYGKKTFELEWEAPGKLRLYTVQGKKKQIEYGRNDSRLVRDEVRTALREQHKIDIDKEVVVIFQSLLKWEDGKTTEIGPYCGSGNALSGTAWVYDDPLLDAVKLSSKNPGGYYGHPVSIGQFNTHYIGGVAHELGHAFGLPHDCEKDDEKAKKGTSLMGSGNHTYGNELRGQGLGTFLTAASALQLSTVRAFVGDLPGNRDRGTWRVEDIGATYKDEKITFTGRFAATPPVIGIIAYNDDMNIESDYDAKTWITKPDSGGQFSVEIGELKQTAYQLRLLAVHEGGQRSQAVYDYTVHADGPDLSPFKVVMLKQAFLENNRQRVDEIVSELTTMFPNNSVLQRKIKLIRSLQQTTPPLDLNGQPADVHHVGLSRAKFVFAATGWGHPQRDSVPEMVFLEVDGEFFESGLYAHAPSSYKFDLGGKWKTFKSGYGLQDGADGSVVFVVRGDGKELFRTPTIKDHQLRRLEIETTEVKILELIVEDGGNGISSDWGVWIEPTLEQ